MNIIFNILLKTEAPYQLDKTVPDIDFEEPQKVKNSEQSTVVSLSRP